MSRYLYVDLKTPPLSECAWRGAKELNVILFFLFSITFPVESDEYDSDFADYALEHEGLMTKRGQISMGEFFDTLFGRDH